MEKCYYLNLQGHGNTLTGRSSSRQEKIFVRHFAALPVLHEMKVRAAATWRRSSAPAEKAGNVRIEGTNIIRIVTDLINALLGNRFVNTVQHATIEEAVFSLDTTDAPIDWLDSDHVICVYYRSMSVPRLYK
jgi:hypothetical protein